MQDALTSRTLAALTPALEHSPALIAITLGPRHLLAFQNAASRRQFGAATLGLPLAEAFAGADATPMGLDLDSVVKTGKIMTVHRREVGPVGLARRPVVLSYVLAPLVSADGGAPDGVVITALDVTSEVNAEQTAARNRLLAEISSVVAAAPSAPAAAQHCTDLLVSHAADFAALYVSGAEDADEGEPIPPAVVSLSPELTPLGPPPRRERRDEPSPWEDVLRTGQPVVIPVSEGALPALGSDPAVATWLRSSRAHSIAVMPIVVAGQLTGALLLLAAGERRPYGDTDLPFFSDVAARVATSLTQLHTDRRRREIAARLQRSLLPPAPPVLPGMSVAARYIAGAPDVEVGGDWWDVQDLGDGRVAIGVGDVSGRGVAAAALMGQARAAMRAAGHARLSPADVLTLLDAHIYDLVGPEQPESGMPPRFATACYAVFEPAESALRIANAGHLPPLIRGRDGSVRVAELPSGAPLGLLAGGFANVSVPVAPGETVAMFTDGLVESRESDLDEGLSALAEAVREYGGHPDLQMVISRLLEVMSRRPGYGDDDVALLLARPD